MLELSSCKMHEVKGFVAKIPLEVNVLVHIKDFYLHVSCVYVKFLAVEK